VSDLPTDTVQAGPPAQGIRLEQRLFEVSPVGTLPTAVAFFVVLIGSFEVAAEITNYSLKAQLTFDPHEGAWPAFILSLLIAVALGMQRYVHLKEREDDPALEHILPSDRSEFAADDKVERSQLRWAALVGVLAGLAVTVATVPANARLEHLPVFVWFAIVTSLLGAMFARGVVMTRIGTREFAQRVDRHLKVDLMRVDELFVIGRRSARSALVWLCVAAIICLFFASGQTPILVIAIVFASAGMAFWIFFRSLGQVHAKIRDAKRAELDHVRGEIVHAKAEAHHDHTAAAKLHGLIAYESRIASVKEWPFDQWTLLRVGAYVLIPALPALAQAGFKYFAEHFHP